MKWNLAEVVEVTPETQRASRIRLRIADWPGHVAGQHVVVRLTAEDGYTAQRSYSIASAPEEPLVHLIVERLDNGEVSPYLTQAVQPGDKLEVRGPIGGFFIWNHDDGGPLQMIAGGSGVVPFLAMLDHRRNHGNEVPARLLYSARMMGDVIDHARLLSDPDVKITLTRNTDPLWTGRTGRFDEDTLRDLAYPPSEGMQTFVCGPSAFVSAISESLMSIGYPLASIKTERFGASQ